MAEQSNEQKIEHISSSSAIPFRQQMQIVRRILKFARPQARQFGLSIVLVILLAFVSASLPRVIQIFIDDYLATGQATTQTALLFAGIYFGLTLIRMTMNFFQLYLFSMASEKTIEHVRNRIFKKIHSLGLRYFDQQSTGWIVTRVTNDTESLKDFWYVLLTIIESTLNVVAALVGMILLSWQLSLVVVLMLPILLVIIRFYQVYSSKTYLAMKSKNSRINTMIAESVNGMSIIQEFRQEKRMNKEFQDINQAYFDLRFRMTKMNALLLAPVINFMRTAATFFILMLFGWRYFSGNVDVGMIYAFVSYISLFFQPLIGLMDNLSLFQDGVISSGRILMVMDDDRYTPDQNPVPGLEIRDAKIEFKHVSFSYDGEHKVLDDISFTVNPGETVALVGQTGSGKSSIINVLMRFYEYQSGEVLIDGHSLRDYPVETLRQEMGLVLQDSFLFYGTIKDNIRLLDKSITDKEIIEAAEFVQANRFIEDLPDGYDSKVVERGEGFSSGEKQLISFASTIVRDPKILILDEATANIDTETESLIQEGLARMREGRTTVAIAHRLSTIRDADQILVLDSGQIIERGTHDELIERGGRYREMYELQNLQNE